jgi:hypothetical protein
LPFFDGKGWQAFDLQMQRAATRYRWDEAEQLDRLIDQLRGKALDFFAELPQVYQQNFLHLRKKLGARFGQKDPPMACRQRLIDLMQYEGESLEEFGERAQRLAARGFPSAGIETINSLAVEAFFRGCREKRAVLFAMDKSPDTVEQALSLICQTINNQNVILGRSRPSRRPHQEQIDDDVSGLPRVRAVNTDSADLPIVRPDLRIVRPDLSTRVDTLETSVSRLSSAVEGTRQEMSAVKHSLSSAEGKLDVAIRLIQGGGSRSPSPRRPGVCSNCQLEGHNFFVCPEVVCFLCKQKGHIQKNCLKALSPNV